MNDEHLGLDMGTMDIKRVFELLEEYSPNAIWNVECKLDYIDKAVEIISDLGYLPNRSHRI
jgi:hypothetical protein